MPKKKQSMSEEEITFSEIIGDLVEQWGFRRHLGRIWSLLYLRREPLNPRQIQSELALSAGNVNLLLAELQTWGVVKRIRIAADRNFYYEAEVQIWKSISNVLRTRELRILEEAVSGLKSLGVSLGRTSGRKEFVVFQLRRVEHVQDAVQAVLMLATLLLQASPERLGKISKLIGRLRGM